MTVKEALLDIKIEKVVLIGHSQGGIIVSMALDNLLSDLPRECPLAPTWVSANNRLSEAGDLHLCCGSESFQ
jgi:triacylglycerol esterase/lipase EstA (alpha/beta hydrolase family)